VVRLQLLNSFFDREIKMSTHFFQSGDYTFGGIPKAEALHWNETTYQMFGKIIYQLYSGDPKVRYTGLKEFYYLKRQFMLDEWDELICHLEKHRLDNGYKSLELMLAEAKDMWKPGCTAEEEPISVPIKMPLIDGNAQKSVPQPSSILCEQLSLF
jgi:hypothetical protein